MASFRAGPDGDGFEGEWERRAMLPPHVFAALTGHLPPDPTTDSMRLYPTRAAAIAALLEATDEPIPSFIEIDTSAAGG